MADPLASFTSHLQSQGAARSRVQERSFRAGIHVLPDFTTSSLDFYASVENTFRAKENPALRVERVD